MIADFSSEIIWPSRVNVAVAWYSPERQVRLESFFLTDRMNWALLRSIVTLRRVTISYFCTPNQKVAMTIAGRWFVSGAVSRPKRSVSIFGKWSKKRKLSRPPASYSIAVSHKVSADELQVSRPDGANGSMRVPLWHTEI